MKAQRRGRPNRLVLGAAALAVMVGGCTGDSNRTVTAGGRPPSPPDTVSTTTTQSPSTTTTAVAPTPPNSSVATTTRPPATGPTSAAITSTSATGPPVTVTTRPRPTTTTTTTRGQPTTTTTIRVPDPRRAVAYAAAEGTRPDYGIVVPITALGTADTAIIVGGVPNGIVATRDGSTVLVANAAGYVTVIDTATNTRRYDIAVCVSAFGIAVTPDGTGAWVTCGQQGTVQPGSVQPIDLIRRQALDPIATGQLPYSIVITPDGKTAYVLNYNGTAPADPEPTIVPVDIATRIARAPIRIGYREGGAMALSPDGRTLYAVAGNGCCASSIAQIETATNRVTRTFPTKCTMARSMAISSDGTTGYLGCFNGVTTVTLDHFSEPAPNAPGLVKGVALTADNNTLYAADWAAGLVVLLDVATMRQCGYVNAESATAVTVVPGVAANIPCLGTVP